jgi:hypothetical protein
MSTNLIGTVQNVGKGLIAPQQQAQLSIGRLNTFPSSSGEEISQKIIKMQKAEMLMVQGSWLPRKLGLLPNTDFANACH